MVNKEESNDKMLPGRVLKNIQYTPNAVTLVYMYEWNSVAEHQDDSGVVESVYLA